MVRVDGHLDTPIYRVPMRLAVVLCLLAPLSAAMTAARVRGFGPFRPTIALIRWVGPAWFLGLGLANLGFALGVRMALAARRRDLDLDEPGGFALVDRHGRREFADDQVAALGYKTAPVLDGKELARRGDARLWLETREGEERVDLSWRFPAGSPDPLAGWLHGLLDRLHARATRELAAGRTLEGQGWELSPDGLRRGDEQDPLPFEAMAAVEYLDGQMAIWERGEVDPSFRVPEGSKDVAILHALLLDRVAPDPEPDPGRAVGPPLGRLLFERRPAARDWMGVWLMGLLLAMILVIGSGPGPRGRGRFRPRRPAPNPPAVVLVLGLMFAPALIRQFSVFRFHERGVARSGLLGRTVLPFEDLARVRSRPLQGGTRCEVRFEPVAGRGRSSLTLITSSADEALETVWRYALAVKPGQGREPALLD